MEYGFITSLLRCNDLFRLGLIVLKALRMILNAEVKRSYRLKLEHLKHSRCCGQLNQPYRQHHEHWEDKREMTIVCSDTRQFAVHIVVVLSEVSRTEQVEALR